MSTAKHGSPAIDKKISTGIEGLDDILSGGLTPKRLYLVEGVPDAGKTTLALNFPIDGTSLGESYHEVKGEIRQAISVIKKRRSEHEQTIRDFKLAKDGIKVGPALREYRGVLTGVPVAERVEG